MLRPSVPFDSFNTRDIHTVDDGVLARLPREILTASQSRSSSPYEDGWAVLVGHFLGADHHHEAPAEMTAVHGWMGDDVRDVT